MHVGQFFVLYELDCVYYQYLLLHTTCTKGVNYFDFSNTKYPYSALPLSLIACAVVATERRFAAVSLLLGDEFKTKFTSRGNSNATRATRQPNTQNEMASCVKSTSRTTFIPCFVPNIVQKLFEGIARILYPHSANFIALRWFSELDCYIFVEGAKG